MVLSGKGAHMRLDQKFGAMSRQVEHKILERILGDGAEQRIHIGCANDAEHIGALMV
jgi:hypothetical protein